MVYIVPLTPELWKQGRISLSLRQPDLCKWVKKKKKSKASNKQISSIKGLFSKSICVIEYYTVTSSRAVKLAFIKMEYSQYIDWRE